MIIRIIFAGLIAFAPSQDGKEMCVVLVDARNPLTVNGELVPPHHPVIRVAERTVVASPMLRQPDALTPDQSALFFLDDESLSFMPNASTEVDLNVFTLAPEQKPNPSKPCCHDVMVCTGTTLCTRHPTAAPFHEQRQDFSWILRPDEAVPDAAHLAGDCFEATPPPSTVVARFKLPAGRLFTYQLEGEAAPTNASTDSIITVAFTAKFPFPEFEPRAVPRRIALEIEVDSSPELLIDAVGFSGIVHKPIHLRDGSVLELMVMNSPMEEIRDPNLGGDMPARHFAHYYRLSETPIDPSNWRVPANAVSAGELLCPPVQMGP